MTQRFKKSLFWIVAAAVLCLTATVAGFASAQTDAETLEKLSPVLDEFGDPVGDAVFTEDEDIQTAYQNYEYGYVSSSVVNGFFYDKKCVGGKNVDANGQETILANKIAAYVLTLTDEVEEDEPTVEEVFDELCAKYDVDKTYDSAAILSKISEKYLALTAEGYNPGIPTGPLSVWNGTLIKLDFYFGDGKTGFGEERNFVTTIAYSLTEDEAFVLKDEAFAFYKDYSNAFALGDMVSDAAAFNDGKGDGTAQAFRDGYIFVSKDRSYAKLGYVINGTSVEKKILTKEELTSSSLTAYEVNVAYEGLTVDALKTAFYNKYLQVVETFDIGVPDLEGLSLWDGKLAKINLVGSEGTGSAWGRISAMLLMGQDKNVYLFKDNFVTALGDESIGLGNPDKIGYPASAEVQGQLNGKTVTYQTLSTGVMVSRGNEYRFVKDVNFEDLKSVESKVDTITLLAYLKPLRYTDFGAATGKLMVTSDGKYVYQNYEMGYVKADLISAERVQNKRDFGGMNLDENLQKYFLTEKMQAWIMSRTDELYLNEEDDEPGKVRKTVSELWGELAVKYGSDVEYDLEYTLGKIYEEYALLCESGYNAGIPTDTLSIWDGAVIKLDFYDGDGEYGFDASDRIHVTTLAYSFKEDRAFYISGDIFKFYKNAKAGSLGDPVSDPYGFVMDGRNGQLQNFEQGFIFCPADDPEEVIVKAGVTLEEDGTFKIIQLSKDEITKTDLLPAAVTASRLYSDMNLEQVKEAFWTKYNELRDSGYNPGIPDAEGIFYWDAYIIKQAYVGSDGTGDAWGRTNMMLMLCPDDGKVYMVNNEILNIVDEGGMGLGTAVKLGYPKFDAKEMVLNGVTFIYQDFSEGTIYSAGGQAQLTRFVKGKSFAEVAAAYANAEQPNNPSYYYVLQPWAIIVICVGGALLVAGAVACVIIIKKKKGASKQAEVTDYVKKETVESEQEQTPVQTEEEEE